MRTHALIVAIGFILGFGLLTAQAADNAKADVAACAKMPGDLDRLACYDSAASKLGVGRKITNKSTSGWAVRTEKSPIDDSTNVWVSRRANGPIRGWPRKTTVPSLFITCRENKTEAYIDLGMSPAVESGDYIHATLRLDSEQAFTQTFGKSTDGQAIFFSFPSGDNEGKLLWFLRRLVDHKQMMLRFTPFNSSPTITTFDLSGLTEALKPLQNACGWVP